MKKIKRDPSSGRSCFAMKYLLLVNLNLLAICLISLQSFAGNINNRTGIGGDETGTGYFLLDITGKVVDEKGTPLAGVSITERGVPNATSSKADGSFSITVANEKAVLMISHVGFTPQEITVGSSRTLFIRLIGSSQTMDSVVVVGYGRQKKQSVVGAISQTTGKVLQRAGGVSTIGGALTGNVPGVITVTGVGTPGAEDPTIYIRGQSTWNNSSPLILVDGIERSINGVDIGSVESISVLKDASATAVFGVKGAN